MQKVADIASLLTSYNSPPLPFLLPSVHSLTHIHTTPFPSPPTNFYYRLLLAPPPPHPPPPPPPPRLVPDAEVMYVVSEILSEVPRPQHWQYGVLVNHMRLLEAVLQHCSIPRERYSETATLLHRIAVSIMCEECG